MPRMVSGEATGTEHGAWSQLPDQDLLGRRPCELGLRIRGSVLERSVRRLRREFEQQGFVFRPHCWLSSGWFSPAGIPGIAIPFFLAHPRLRALEVAQMGEVEGGDEAWCLRILRHEAGHAIDTAYRLHRRRAWREAFGPWGEPYHATYVPRPLDRRFVLHLDHWYAQSHPAEDFAETFAVWLTAGSDWRRRYAGWGALEKLELVNALMDEVREREPVVTSRERLEPVSSMRATLEKFYAGRKRARAGQRNDYYDRELRALFRPRSSKREPAAVWLRDHAPEITALTSPAEPELERTYNIEQVLSGLATRAHELGLTVDDAPRADRLAAAGRAVEDVLGRLHDGYFRIAR